MPDDIDKFISEAKTAAAKTPMDEESAKRYAELRGRRGKELEGWHAWNNQGRKQEHLEPLLASIHPLIKRETTKRLGGLGGSIPRSALEAALTRAAVAGIESYDPERGVQLTTHIHNNFQRATDFISGNRNARYLPRGKLDKAGEVMAAREEFTQNHGRPPTFAELHAALPKWKHKELHEIVHATAPEVHSGVSEFSNDNSADIDKYRSAVLLVYGKLNAQEKQFADMHYPAAGEHPQTIRQIAKKLGIPEHKVYRIRSRVDNHLSPLLKSS